MIRRTSQQEREREKQISMDFASCFRCFRCCLSSDKGSYSTYDRERRQSPAHNTNSNHSPHHHQHHHHHHHHHQSGNNLDDNNNTTNTVNIEQTQKSRSQQNLTTLANPQVEQQHKPVRDTNTKNKSTTSSSSKKTTG